MAIVSITLYQNEFGLCMCKVQLYLQLILFQGAVLLVWGQAMFGEDIDLADRA